MHPKGRSSSAVTGSFFVFAMNVRLAVQRAIRLHSDGRLAAAVNAYRAILKRHPETCACWSNLGMALRTLGRKDEGIEALREGVGVCPQVPELNYNLGNAPKEAGDHEGAVTHYRAACTLEPGNLEAARACGVMLMRLERFDEAVEHYGAALGRHADDSKLCAGLALALWRLHRPAAAAGGRARSCVIRPTPASARRAALAGQMTKRTRSSCAPDWRGMPTRRCCSRRWDRA